MKTKLIELETSKKLLEEVLHTTYTQLINNVEHAINNLIVDSHDAKLLRKWIRNDDKGLYLCFEVGFYNDVEQRIDFGSDVSFYYSVERGLEVNYGTIGMYSKKNMYQVKRIKLIADVFDRIDIIESELKTIIESDVATRYIDLEHQSFMVDVQIKSVKEQMKTNELNNIAETLKEGATVNYADNTPYSSMLFDTKYFNWTIHKVCDKTIKVKSSDGVIKQFPKKDILTAIYNKKLIVEGHDD